MLKVLKLAWFVAILVVFIVFFYTKARPTPQASQQLHMKIESVAFANKQHIPTSFTCDGKDVSPPLSFQDVPKNTKSLVLLVDDPDAPSGTWTHWIIINIPPQTTGIAENSTVPGALYINNSFGKKQYGGPCPPNGTHRYFFTLYALDSMLSARITGRGALETAIGGHILGKAQLAGLYKRT